MWWGVQQGMGWWMLLGGLWVLLFWGAIIALVVWGIRALARNPVGTGGASRPPEVDDPLEIAQRRYARGEISREQYEEIKSTLGSER